MIRKRKFFIVGIIILVVAVFIVGNMRQKKGTGEIVDEIVPSRGSIQTTFSTTGTVLPKNRLEIKPPVNGRVEEVLVKEGEKVKDGQLLAWMSSTERAALLDAAQGQGEEKLRYWEDAYKPIALLAPIDAEVIVATVQPGQTVTIGDAVLVLSDQLIVRAYVDETDIGKVLLDQDAVVSLDAYPDDKINARVDHIYYESETVNNVTVYKVDLITDTIPDFFRSGMNAAIDFINESKDNILLIPLEAVHSDEEQDYILLKEIDQEKPVKRMVELGIFDDENIEVISGINEGDKIILKRVKFSLPESNNNGTNPFLPSRRKSSSSSGSRQGSR